MTRVTYSSYDYVLKLGDLRLDDRITLPQRNRSSIGKDRLRSIEIVKGWQIDRIISEFPLFITWTWFRLMLIWSAVMVCLVGITNDWDTAIIFGQPLAASVTLTIVHTRTCFDVERVLERYPDDLLMASR